jgi:hypothetical protein
MYIQPGVYMTKKFKLTVVIWSLFLIGVILYNYIKRHNILWCYLLISQQSLTWLILIAYQLLSLISSTSESQSKSFHLTLLTISGPLLLSLSLYGFVTKEELDINFYALSFMAWWVLFTISVYSSFELTLDIALFYHRKKKAKYYDSLENPSSPLMK